MRVTLKEMIRNETGQTTTEYGLLLGFLAAGIILPLVGMRDGLRGVFEAADQALQLGVPNNGCGGG